jgi:hypothetical protein
MISTTSTYQLASFPPGSPPPSFSFSFSFEQTSEIYAVLYGTGLPGAPLTQGVDYSVSPTPPSASGTIIVMGSNWAGAYAAYGNIRIYRKTAIVNNTALVNGGAIDANVLEFVIDEITQIMQEQGAGGIAAIFDLVAPVTDPPGLNYILPAASVRAGTGLLFDANGNVIAGSPSAVTINAIFQAALLSGTTTLLLALLNSPTFLVTGNSPFSIPVALNQLLIVVATSNPFLANLPAATGSGDRVRIIDGSLLATGLVKITPNGTDKIGSAGNVSVYLQNIDQSGAPFLFQSIELVDEVPGYWAVVSGQFCPHQTVDTDGQQYHLGKLHHLPLGNTTSRLEMNSLNPAALNNWYASAITAAGLFGVPTGAKGIRVRVYGNNYAVAAGLTQIGVSFSDNNSNVPVFSTAHPIFGIYGYVAASGYLYGIPTEIDIPLNSSGQFFMYTVISSNNTPGSSQINGAIVGFYMGD